MAALHYTLLCLLTLLTALYTLGLSAYWIHQARRSSLPLSRTIWSVSIISGCAALWCILALPLFLRPRLLPAVALLDVVFGGGMAATAILLRAHAAANCGEDRDCKLSKAAFAVSIAAAVFFFVLAALAWNTHRVYKRNRAFGPIPANGYSTTVPRGKRGSRWSGSSAGDGAGPMAETNSSMFTRHSARGYGHSGHHHQREAGDRGGFDPSPLQHHGEGVGKYQAF